MGIRGRRLALAAAVVLVPACAEDAAPGVAAAERAEEGASRVELLRADAEGGRWTVVAHTRDGGETICLDVAEPGRGVAGGCMDVPDAELWVKGDGTAGLVFGFLTGHAEVAQVRVTGGGREVVLPLRLEAVRPAPVHRFSGEPIPIRFFAVADPVGFNAFGVEALDRHGAVVDVVVNRG